MTKTQKDALRALQAEKIRKGNVRLARAVLIFFLLVSLAANVAASLDGGPVSIAIGAFVPFALFVTNMMFERLGAGLHGVKKFVTLAGIGAGVLITGYVSYVHIFTLVHGATGNVVFAAIIPFSVDIPMILAALVLSEARNAATLAEVPAPAVKRSATSTAPAQATVAKPSRTRTANVKPAIA